MKRFQMVGQYDEWQMEQVDGCGVDCSSETEWVKADDHAAALLAKDAEIARLRELLNEASEVLHGQMERGTSDMAHKIDAQLKGETP